MNQGSFPTQKGAPQGSGEPALLDYEWLTGISAKPFPIVQLQKGVLYPFFAQSQFFQVIAFTPQNDLTDNAANALRYTWPDGWRYIALIEVQISQAVGVDEDFEVEMFGCVYSGSGLVRNSPLLTIDAAAANKITFALGDTSTKRSLVMFPAEVGGMPITQIAPRITSTGANFYQGETSVFIHGGP